MNKIKKMVSIEMKKNWLPWSIALITLILFTFFIYENRSTFLVQREFEHTNITQKKSDGTIGEITGDMVISQTFISEKDEFSRIQLPFGTYNRLNEGEISFELIEVKSNKVYYKETLPLQELHDGQYQNIDFPSIQNSKGKKYEIRLTGMGLQNGKTVTIWSSSVDYLPSGQLKIDEKKQTGDLRFIVLDVELKPLLNKKEFVLAVFGLISMFLISLVAVRKYKNEVHRVFLIIVIPIGLVLSIIIPPFDQLDELEHYYRAFEVSEGKWINQTTEQGLGNYIPVSLLDTVNDVRFIHHEGYKYSLVKEALGKKLNPDDRIFMRNYASSYPPIIYIPQSLGMLIGRLFFDSPLIMMVLGRIFNFLAYTTIAYAALKIVPIKKYLFLTLALLPMSVIHSASLSGDAITNSTSLLFVSYILYLAYGPVITIERKHLYTSIVIGVFIALSKIVYLPIILLFLIIPFKKFKNKKVYIKNLIFVLLGCTIPFIIWNLMNISNLSVPDVRFNAQVNPKDQILFILSHPLQYLKIFMVTLMNQGPLQFVQMVGKAATNYIYLAPSIVIYTFILLLFLFGLISDESDLKAEVKATDKVIFLFILLSVFVLIYTALYVGFTIVGGSEIGGIQGRYFVPIAVFLFLTLYNKIIIIRDKSISFLISAILHCMMYTLLLKYLIDINS